LHLRTTPHKLALSEIQKAKRWAAEYDIIQQIKEVYDIAIPSETDEPIVALGRPKTNGYRCTYLPECAFVGET
jgi:hypothetical protein